MDFVDPPPVCILSTHSGQRGESHAGEHRALDVGEVHRAEDGGGRKDGHEINHGVEKEGQWHRDQSRSV